jgi:curved DNA-binding protein CbpA
LKTLYTILGIDPGATEKQVEQAFNNFSSKLKEYSSDDLSAEEIKNQTIAVREAYRTLANPILRQRYDQKIADADFDRLHGQNRSPYETTGGSVFGIKSIALIGLIIVAGLYFYNQNMKEREKLRAEHEREVKIKAVQIAEDLQKQNTNVSDTVRPSSTRADSPPIHSLQQQFERESIQAQRLDNQRRQLELQQQQQQQRTEDRRLQQEQQRNQQQLQSEKRLLQQMERDRYGKVITY